MKQTKFMVLSEFKAIKQAIKELYNLFKQTTK